MKNNFFFLPVMLLVNSFQAHAFTSSYSLEMIDLISLSQGRTSGHEEITRQALVKTKRLLIDNRSNVDIARGGIQLLNDLDASKRGLVGALSKNPVIKGVYCSDFPDNSKCLFNLAEYWYGENYKNINWHSGETTQSLHFLRDYDSRTGLVSPYEACMEGRNKISTVAKSAVQEWKKGEIAHSLFLLGHAIHIIQDSFSHAHVIRDVKPGKHFKIKDICYYGSGKRQELSVLKKENMACFHPMVDFSLSSVEESVLGDSIWVRTADQKREAAAHFSDEPVKRCSMMTHQYMIFDSDKEACLNLESRLARDATIKFLYLMAEDLYKHRDVEYDEVELEKLDQLLTKKLFEGSFPIKGMSDRMPNGIAQCDHLYGKK